MYEYLQGGGGGSDLEYEAQRNPGRRLNKNIWQLTLVRALQIGLITTAPLYAST